MPIIVYHYIRNQINGDFNLNACSEENFKKQIKFLVQHYKIVSLTELINLKKENRDFKKYVAISFDDGVAEHYKYAFPILLACKIKATFFPVGCVFDNEIPLVTKMHIVFSKKNSQSIAYLLEKYLVKTYLGKFNNFNISAKRRINKTKRLKDDILTANIKQILSELPIDIKSIFINPLFDEIIGDKDRFIKTFFMNKTQLIDMKRMGMDIGSHGYNHSSLKSLNKNEQLEDISKSKNILEESISTNITGFSYPFGDYNIDTIPILKNLGFKYGVSYDHKELLGLDNFFNLSSGDYGDFFK